MIHPLKLTLLSVLPLLSAAAQTTTTYTLPTGTICNNIENCSYTIDNGSQSGVFEAGGYWTQFDYRAYPGQNPGYNADYCNGTAVWSVADTPDLGPTAKLFEMDCSATDLNGVPSKLHVTIQAHSYVASFACGSRVRTTCHQTRWIVDSGDLEITK